MDLLLDLLWHGTLMWIFGGAVVLGLVELAVLYAIAVVYPLTWVWRQLRPLPPAPPPEPELDLDALIARLRASTKKGDPKAAPLDSRSRAA
jgi:hypothetical protein